MFRYSRQDIRGTLVQTDDSNLVAFGTRLQRLRRRAGFSQKQLAEMLDHLAQSGPVEEYRVIDDTLISRWEGARMYKGRHWKPTRPYVLYLIRVFTYLLDVESAHDWAIAAGCHVSPAELQPYFPALPPVQTACAEPVPNSSAVPNAEHPATVALTPDVAAAFPTSEAVNRALRLVMQLASLSGSIPDPTTTDRGSQALRAASPHGAESGAGNWPAIC